MPRSILYAPAPPHTQPAACGPARTEVEITFRKDGRSYTLKLRDKVVVEDPYLVLLKASAFAVRTGEPYQGRITPRSLKDFLIKSVSPTI